MFLQRLKENQNIVKEDNPTDHFCSFFVPVNSKTQSIFLGHHIKADDWIPPDGHIEKEEHPLSAVIREFYEELSYKLTDEKIELFDISKIKVRKTKRACKIHYDFWYIVHVDKINFIVDKNEFYDAKWFSKEEALSKIKREEYKAVIQKLYFNYLNH